MPLARRLPKRGFTNIFRRAAQVVNVKDLARFDANTVVDAAALAAAGLVAHGNRPVKVLGEGELSSAVKLSVHAISASARQKVEAAGGSVEIAPKRGGTKAS
jgi:large subunit ribosomal protein L15